MKIPVDQIKCKNCGMIKLTMNTFPLHNDLSRTWDRTSKCCSHPNYVWYKAKTPGKKGRWVQKYV